MAHGDRRAETHYEADPGQLVRASHLVKPDQPTPPETPSPADPDAVSGPPPVQDVGVPADSPSAWDASPPEED